MTRRSPVDRAEQPWLTLSNVCFNHAGSKSGIRDVSLEVSRGTVVAVIGANGSGKSTLLRLIAGILEPQSGTVTLGGGGPLRPGRALARRIAYVPQTHDIVFPFPVLDVVLAGRSPYTARFGFESEADRVVAMESLRAVGIAHLASRPVTEVSVGERQLVSIARGLAQEPECLLLDEPTAALDLVHRWQVIQVVKRMRAARGLTTLFVTHDLEALDDGFSQVVAMREGSLVAAGTPSTIVCEDTLGRVFGDLGIRIRRVEGRTFIWSR